jgi:RimJ/RimL family protein N-acetyltransferase
MKDKIIFQGKTKTGLDLIIRYLKLSDVQLLTDFINKISQEKTFITFQGEQSSLKDEKKYVAGKIKNIKNKKSVHLLGFINNELVANSDIDMKEKVFSHIGNFGLIVAKKYRGEGIGKIIMNAVLEESEKNIKDLKIVILGVFANNPIAQNLYKKLGFIEYGRLPEGLKHKGNFVDEILMYKKIK